MKKLIAGMCVATAAIAFADNTNKVETVETESTDAPIFWGFAAYGINSGYQLYGSIINPDPVLQGYGEINANLPWAVGNMDDLGYFGFGLFSNSDLTGRRTESYRRAFNEFDFNLHWQKTFFFDEEKQWGLTYRTYVVWYWYPVTSNRHPVNPLTFDWDHYFELQNPYLIPYINIVHEYAKTDGNLLQFGVKKPFNDVFGVEGLSLCPFIEFVWRDRKYGWCFSNYGMDENYEMQSAGLATMKLELDATYMFTKWFGVYAKVAYCQNLDPHMRESANFANGPRCHDEMVYGRYNEFAWGGVGVVLCF